MKTITYLSIFLLLLSSCASMLAPTGGDKDIDAPTLILINKIEKKTKTISFQFDEFIQLNEWQKNFYVSPPLTKRIQKTIKGTSLYLTIDDSLKQNTTYYFALNSCIKDYNEGNILDTLSYTLTTSETQDSLKISGKLQDSYTLEPIENAWVMLYETTKVDSLIFKETPSYIAKSDKNGMFLFPNLNTSDYQVVALTDFDFIYDEGESIAFQKEIINAKKDSFINLNCFKPLPSIESTSTDTIEILEDSLSADSSTTEMLGKLTITSATNLPCVFQLIQDDKVIYDFSFSKPPYTMENIAAGKYQLKYIIDSNNDKKWTTGDWKEKQQAEQVINYPSEITIRSNWDMELVWEINLPN